MRRRGNKKIGRQILGGIFAAVFLTVVLFAVISIFGLMRVRKEIIYSDSEVIEAIADDEVEKVMKNISDEMGRQCENFALNCAEKMKGYMEELHICTGIISDIYENPNNYGKNTITVPSEKTRGRLTLYYSLNKEMNLSDYSGLIEKIGCSENVFRSVYENSRLNSIYYTTKEGILFSFDANSGEVLDKLEPSQSPVYLHGYEPRETEWYKNSCNEGKGSVKFTGTYLDSTGQLVVTCSEPVYKGEEYMGVMAIDIYLGNLKEELIGTDNIQYEGFVEITEDSGNVIVSPNISENETEYTRINIFTNETEGLKDIAEDMVSGEKGSRRFTYKGRESQAVYMPIEYTGWSIAVIFDADMVMEEVYDSYDDIMEANKKTESNVEKIIQDIVIFFFAGAIGVMMFVILPARIISSQITRPIEELIDDVGVISHGNLDYLVNVNTGNELQKLGEAFNNMTLSLKEYMKNLKTVTADKERIATELNVAANIQLSMLPGEDGKFGEGFFEIEGYMKPAKEIGGDFYDYFMTDENHLWIVTADVSGKGIPAALFMMMGKTLIKNMAGTMKEPGEILETVNDRLNENNDEMMFITCFVGVVDLTGGCFTFANAGHNFPFLLDSRGCFEKLETRPDIPLAVMEGVKYKNHSVNLKEGDRLYLYTDGVTEAMNSAGELYGESRLYNIINDIHVKNIKGNIFLQEVKNDIKEFSGDALQADDITMVIFTYIKAKRHIDEQKKIIVSGNLRELGRVLDFVEENLCQACFDREFITTVKFMTDELFSNIAMYAYQDKEGEAAVILNIIEGEGVELTFMDAGIPYNPLNQPEPDILLPLEERTEGGLGIYLVRTMADKMEYKYADGKNVLKVWKKSGKED